jgi:signal transduction histidine kinase
VVRHSRATWCRIVVQQSDQAVWVDMTNDGYQAEMAETHSGRGLAGLNERVAMLGGQMESGPQTSQGHTSFSLRAEIPLLEEQGGEDTV